MYVWQGSEHGRHAAIVGWGKLGQDSVSKWGVGGALGDCVEGGSIDRILLEMLFGSEGNMGNVFADA